MRHLFVVRHGDYGYGDRLNHHGRHQIEVLGKTIKEILNEGSAYLVSSTAPRALDSSEVLIEQLGLEGFEQIPYLWSGSDAPRERSYCWSIMPNIQVKNLDRLMEIVNERRNKADGLVIVTHLEVAEDFPSYFLKVEFGVEERIREIDRGQAVHIDLEQKAYHILP